MTDPRSAAQAAEATARRVAGGEGVASGNDLSVVLLPLRQARLWWCGPSDSEPPAVLAEADLGASRPAEPDAEAASDWPEADYVVLPYSAVDAALHARRPFRLPWPDRSSAPPAALEALTRLLEGGRLVGGGADVGPHPMAAVVGPMMTTQQVVRATKTSRQNLAAQAGKRRLIRLASTENTQWWPTLQFRRAGSRVVPHPGVRALAGRRVTPADA